MSRKLPLLVASLFVLGAMFVPSHHELDAAPRKFQYRPPTRVAPVRILRVQARSPQWRAVTVAPNLVVARNIKRNLTHRGWQVQMRANSAGAVAIRARVVHWHTRAVVAHPVAAQRLASILRYQGLQARVR